MKPHTQYNELINKYYEIGRDAVARRINEELIDKGPGGKYEWYVDLSEKQGKTLKELYENRNQKGTLEGILKNITNETREEIEGISIGYSKDNFSIYLGSPLLGAKQSIEFKYHSEEKNIREFEKIRIVSYKKNVNEMVYLLAGFEWKLRKTGLEFI